MKKKISFILGLLFVTGICLLGAGNLEAAVEYTVTDLGDLPGGPVYSYACGVSADGSVVIGQSESALGWEAFRWTTGGGMVGLGALPGGPFSSGATGVSGDGSVIVGSGGEAFRWTTGGGMVGLGDLPGGEFSSSAWNISADGSVIVGQGNSASGYEAFRWTSDGGMVGLGDLPDGEFYSTASGVSGDGSVIVGRSKSASGMEAFRWASGGGMVGLGGLSGGGFRSMALDVSTDGSVVVGSSSNALGWEEAFRWTSGSGMVGLGDLPGGLVYSMASGVNADGSVIVGSSSSASGQWEAFRWTSGGGMESLNDLIDPNSGWFLKEAIQDVSDLGHIVGSGTFNNETHAFLLTPVCSYATPANPSPANGATDVSLGVELGWDNPDGDGYPNGKSLLSTSFEDLSLSNPDSISPFLYKGEAYRRSPVLHSEFTNWTVSSNSRTGNLAINLIPNGNPTTTVSSSISSAYLNRVFDVSGYGSVSLKLWVNSTSNPRIASVHNCDSGLSIL